MYTNNVSPLIWTIPIISETSIFEFQLYNLLKTPISWALKYNGCIKCTMENKNNKHMIKKDYLNKCVHHRYIHIIPNSHSNASCKHLKYTYSIEFLYLLLLDANLNSTPTTALD